MSTSASSVYNYINFATNKYMYVKVSKLNFGLIENDLTKKKIIAYTYI